MNNAVEIRGLIKTYGETHAVAGVDLDVRTGEVFALLGPNGAGKTTTIEILEGYRDRDGGTVSVLGEDPSKAGLTWRNKIGIVLQSNNDAAEITVEEILNFFSDYYVNPRNVDEVINAVGLEEKRKSRGRELSGGQRRRLDVALGILGNPELLFLDEPTTGLDPRGRMEMWGVIEELVKDGVTLLLTTQYLEEADQLADEIAVIDTGKVIARGTSDALKKQVGGERLAVVAVVAVHDVQVVDFLEVVLGVVRGERLGGAGVEAAAEQRHQALLPEAVLVGPLPGVLELGDVLGFVVGGVEVVHAGFEAGVHDGQVLVRKGHIDAEGGLEILHQSHQLGNHIGIHGSGRHMAFTDFGRDAIAFGTGSGSQHQVSKDVRQGGAFVGYHGPYPTGTNNQGSFHNNLYFGFSV